MPLLVRVRPAGGSVYLCWVSGGGREDGGSGSILGVVGGFIFFLFNIVGDGTGFGFLRPCETGEILCIPGHVLLVRVAALVTDVGLRVCLPAAVDCLLGCGAGGACSGTLCFRSSASWLAVADWMPVFTCCGDGRCAWEAVYSASSPSSKSSSAVSTLDFVVGEDGGYWLGSGGLRWPKLSRTLSTLGLLVVIYNISRVFSVKFHGCTVLSG